jgi:ABC-type phosphate transport system substrate-binding protein
VLLICPATLLTQWAGRAGAATETLTVSGGTFFAPALSKIFTDDATGLAPVLPFFSSETLDTGIADFIGTGQNSFNSDVAIAERPLTSTEAAKAQANGRTFAYVPIAATPVAIVTLVPNSTYVVGSPTIAPSDFCQHIPLTLDQLGGLFGYDTSAPYTWGDSRLSCTATQGLDSYPVTRWANLDVTMENQDVMALLDSDPTSKALFDAGLAQAAAQQAAISTSDTPSESWPYSADTFPQGDQNLIGHMLSINPRTNEPSTNSSLWALGAIAPISSEWTGSPLGAQWDLPTAAVQNAANATVAPSVAAATAAEASTTLGTDNTVTFNASTDATAYNNYLMVEDYLVVPTTGLDAAKDTALAQLIRFAVGTTGQADIEKYGSAPADAAMTTADLKVAAQLSQAGLTAATTSDSSTTTTTTAASGTTTTTSAASAASNSAAGASGSDPGGSGGSTSSSGAGGGLAFTGAGAIWPLVVIGALLATFGTGLRRRLRRRGVLGAEPSPAGSGVRRKDSTR